jgi:hypothetical protein
LLPHVEKFGIYFNSSENKVVRITSPYWFPPEPEWVYLTREVNSTLTSIREIIKNEKLSDKSEEVSWGRIPLLD